MVKHLMGTISFIVFGLKVCAGIVSSTQQSAVVTVDFRDYTLTVTSEQGSPEPSVGSHVYAWKTPVICTVQPAALGGTVRYICTGWTGGGAVPLTGETFNTGIFVLTNTDSSIQWNWIVSTQEQSGLFVDASRPDDNGVATNWATAKRTIQAAVDLATDGDTVWVTNGVYAAGGTIAPPFADPWSYEGELVTSALTNRVCITKAVTVRSVNGPEVTIIQGASDNGTTGPAAVRCAYLTSGATMEGFTLTGGYSLSYGSGGWLDAAGGGALLFTNAALNSCIMTGNSAAYGGGAFCNGGGTLNNCLLNGNTAGDGGGALIDRGTLNNCTSVGNSANEYPGPWGYNIGGHGGGLSVYMGALNNCIVWSNTASVDGINIFRSDATISNTCSSPLPEGEGNICADPLFVDSVSSNFHLQAGSPCINAGDNSYVSVTNDLDGTPRIIGGVVDMGAYEEDASAYLIETTCGNNGHITPEDPWVVQGRDQIFQISPNEGYCIDSLVVDGISVPVTSSYVFTEIQSAHTITATFKVSYYSIEVKNGLGSGTYTNGAVVLVSADSASEGSGFLEWSAIPSEHIRRLTSRISASTTFTMPSTNVVLNARFGSMTTYVDASMQNDIADGLSWLTAKKTIQAAVDVTANNGTVWVTNGVYDTGGTNHPGFWVNDYYVTLYGPNNRVYITRPIVVRSVNGPLFTTIKGAPGSAGDFCSDSVRGVFMQNGSSLIGFTVANGRTSYQGITAYECDGGGVWLDGDCIVSDCILTKNSSKSGGAGARLDGDAMLNNCLVVGNTSTGYGGAGVLLGGNATVNNCTISDNHANAESGGGLRMFASGTVNNCIVWGNTAPGPDDIAKSWTGATIQYTCSSTSVTNGIDGCTTNNPLFIDSINSNFQLQAGSPCINAGRNSYISITNDLIGNPRIVGGVVDMGAYENQAAGSDADSDGMDDLWELDRFGGRHFADPDTVCSNDVNTLLQAYIAGLDPNDPDSKFSAAMLPGSVLQWPCVSGRVYSVYFSTNLLSGFQPLETNIPWTAGSFTDTVHNVFGQGYYRVKVDLE